MESTHSTAIYYKRLFAVIPLSRAIAGSLKRDAFPGKHHADAIFHIIPCHLVLTSCPLS
jgi:hypothetical protein